MTAAPTRAVLRRAAAAQLAGAGVEGAWEEADALCLWAFETNRLGLTLDGALAVGPAAAERLEEALRRRLAGEPATRIVGRRGFWTLDIEVRAAVLDPRPDSESVIEAALRLRPGGAGVGRALDLGCGSGALLGALLAEFPQAFGVGVDLSAAACAASAANLSANGLAGRFGLVRGLWGESLAGAFDLIVSNPPYIESAAMAGLAREVVDHDPALALDGGADGLDAYRALAPQTARLLAPEGVAIFEIGAGQRPDVEAICGRAGLILLESVRDLGGHERALAFAPAPVRRR